LEERPGPQAIVVFGASGDLARRKILPALYNLAVERLLPERTAVVGFAASEWDDEEFRRRARASIEEFSRSGLDEDAFWAFASSLSFVSGRFDEPDRMAALGDHLHAVDEARGTAGGRLYYLATPPSAIGVIVEGLRAIGPGDPTQARLIVEKPFGRDLDSARRLNGTIHAVFQESQIFRIDHYLGKETVQNIIAFRFANALFERIWNRDAVESIQVTVAETLGVEGRGAYYEEAGALRDLVQNHMLQVLGFLTMEPPRSLADPEAFREEKVKVLKAVHPIDPGDVVRGQYTAGEIDGTPVDGYREEASVAPDSVTETYAAVKLHIDTWRWQGVPMYLRHGKRLPRRQTQVDVAFRAPPTYLWEELGIEDLPPNHLTIQIQPEEGVTLHLQAKQPGAGLMPQTVRMGFDYGDSFLSRPAEAYERLIHDAMSGDVLLFPRQDGVERSWEIVGRALDRPGPVHPYPAGTWGPEAADALIAPHAWHLH
jgi:glucose-6-phosphate 1-dehydrogenase